MIPDVARSERFVRDYVRGVLGSAALQREAMIRTKLFKGPYPVGGTGRTVRLRKKKEARMVKEMGRWWKSIGLNAKGSGLC